MLLTQMYIKYIFLIIATYFYLHKSLIQDFS